MICIFETLNEQIVNDRYRFGYDSFPKYKFSIVDTVDGEIVDVCYPHINLLFILVNYCRQLNKENKEYLNEIENL